MNAIPKEILEDMNYINLAEIRSISEELGIPYKILYKKGNRLCKTSAFDRKDVLLERIRTYAATRKLPAPTVLAEKVVDLGPIPAKPQKTDLIKFGQFKHGHKGIENLLDELSDRKFKDSALARDVLRDFWLNGRAPNYKKFLQAWYKAVENHKQPKAEWAYLTDLGNGMEMTKWKEYRIERANRAVQFLRRMILGNK